MLNLEKIKGRRSTYFGQTGEQRAEFIACAPADIDALVAEVEQLQSDIIDAHLELIALDPLLPCGHHRSAIVGECRECGSIVADAPQPCGHPHSAIITTVCKEGELISSYCGECENES